MKDRKKVLWIAQAAVIAALYAAITFAQHMIAPGTASMAVQFRVSEAMTLLCCLTTAAIPGLTLGCFAANFLFMTTLPLDMILGSIETWHGRWLRGGFAPLHREFAAIDCLKGRTLSVRQTDDDSAPLTGFCGGIAPDGSLIVGGRPVYAGEAHVMEA